MQAPDFIRKNGLVITLHVAGLLLYIFSPLFFGGVRSLRTDASVQWPLVANNALIAGFFYLNMLVLMPYVLKNKGWLPYLATGIVSMLFFVAVSHYLREAFFHPGPGPGFGPAPDQMRRLRPRPPLYIIGFFPYLISWIFSISVRFSMDYLRLERQRKESETESLKAELSLLRSQISPHFMFNVLNSLTALARKKSDDMEPIIIKLSQLMRYTIYYSAVPRVDLETELEYLQNYIGLQKLRFGNVLNVKFENNIQQPDFQIEPMLLISFVENAFKHGSGMITDPVIEITIDCRDNILKFKVLNKFVPDTEKDDTHGVGLKNVKRRLELLYENHHELIIKGLPPWFVVELTLIGK